MSNVIQLKVKGEVKSGERDFTKLIGGFGEDKPIITDKQVAELLNCKNGARQVRELINKNKKYFKDGVDIQDVKGVDQTDTLDEVLKSVGYAKQAITQSKNIYILSQAGFLLYLKFAEGDKAVELYKDFIEDYFEVVAENKKMKDTMQEELEFLKEQKAMFLGRMFMEKDDSKKMELFNESEKVGGRITELEKSLSIEETKKEIIEKLQPELQVAELIENSKSNFDMGKFAKIVDAKNMGRNNMMKWLRDKGFLMQDNEPFQRYTNYFGVVPIVKNSFTNNKTVVKPKGVKFIVNKLIEDGKVITKSLDQIIEELGMAN